MPSEVPVSPTTWLAFFDIILVVLSCFNIMNDNLLLSGLQENLAYALDPAYMDHVITPSASLESLQKKEDIMFGIDIAVH